MIERERERKMREKKEERFSVSFRHLAPIERKRLDARWLHD